MNNDDEVKETELTEHKETVEEKIKRIQSVSDALSRAMEAYTVGREKMNANQ